MTSRPAPDEQSDRADPPPRVGPYALRRTLPPWKFDAALADLLAVCRTARIDEVIFKIDAEEFNHGIPALAWVESYLPMLRRARDAVQEIGVAFSLNPWVTLGHIDRGRDLRATFPEMTWIVGHDGAECRACACPLSQGWQEHTTSLWRAYASLRPRVIWVEDDLRSFNHLPVRYGCFCPAHLARFAALAGATVTREEVVRAVLAPGPPHAWRAMWFRVQATALREAAAALGAAVQGVSPETRLGLMSSGAENHSIEGRDWSEHAAALAGGRDTVIHSRPPLGNYTEGRLTDLYYAARQIKRTRAVMPAGVVEQTEVESVPFGPYAKSVTFTLLQIAVSVAHGCAGATMNLYDHLGTPAEDVHPRLAQSLADHKPYFGAVAAAHAGVGRFNGVRILHHATRAAERRVLAAGANWSDLIPRDDGWDAILNAFGVVTTYASAPASKLTAASGQSLRAYDDDGILDMLRGGLLLDLPALEALIDRGFGAYAGVDIGRTSGMHEGRAVAAEELFDTDFGGENGRYVTATLPDLLGNVRCGTLTPRPAADGGVAARFISRLIDADRDEIGGFSTVFENALGGRVAVVPVEVADVAAAFLNPYRRRHLLSILRWLNRASLPAVCSGGPFPLACRTDIGDDTVLLTAFNLTLDDWPAVEWALDLPARAMIRVEQFAPDGTCRDVSAAVMFTESNVGTTMRIDAPLNFRSPLILRLHVDPCRRGDAATHPAGV